MNAVTEDMIIDAVDQQDTPVGSVRRQDVFQQKANFRVAHIFLFNQNTELLLQQLASSRKRNPGFWGSSVAGYLFAGESYDQAAKRRLNEELGVSADLQLFGKTSMVDEGCKKFISLYVATCEGPFQYDRTNIAQIEYLSISAVRRMQDGQERRFTPTFLHLLDFYQPR